MEPTLYHNDLLVTCTKAPNEIKIGEIVVISSTRYYIENEGAAQFSSYDNNTKIIHRVINKKEVNGTWFFQTKGDNNILIDGSVICIKKSINGEPDDDGCQKKDEKQLIGTESFHKR